MMFYTTVYVGDVYKSGSPDSVDPMSEEVDAEATPLGTRAHASVSTPISLFRCWCPKRPSVGRSGTYFKRKGER